jgi:hypothetical protein
MITNRFQFVDGYVKSQNMRKYHTREQRLEALNKLVTRAYRVDPDGEAIFHVPPLDDDADVILYQAVDELEERGSNWPKAYIATIEGGSYGLRDFPDGKPGIWFGVKYGHPDGFGALIVIMWDEVEDFMVQNKVNDIKDLNGQKCIIVDEGGLVRFISLFFPKG